MPTPGLSKITFDDVVVNLLTYAYDGDLDSGGNPAPDGIADVVFTTTDTVGYANYGPGFNRTGPGPNMAYIVGFGLEGTAQLAVDLRVDFTYGARTYVKFGFALYTYPPSPDGVVGPEYYCRFSLYSATDVLLGTQQVAGAYSVLPPPTFWSSFPEGQIDLSFSGIAAYGIFEFVSYGAFLDLPPYPFEYGRYIIDNFEGYFGSVQVPDPVVLSRSRRPFWNILAAWAPALPLPLLLSSSSPLIPAEPAAIPSNRHFRVTHLQVLYGLGGFSGGNKA